MVVPAEMIEFENFFVELARNLVTRELLKCPGLQKMTLAQRCTRKTKARWRRSATRMLTASGGVPRNRHLAPVAALAQWPPDLNRRPDRRSLISMIPRTW